MFGGTLIKEAARKFRDPVGDNSKIRGQNKRVGKATFSWAIWCLLLLWSVNLSDISAGRGREMEAVQAEVMGKASTVRLATVRTTPRT